MQKQVVWSTRAQHLCRYSAGTYAVDFKPHFLIILNLSKECSPLLLFKSLGVSKLPVKKLGQGKKEEGTKFGEVWFILSATLCSRILSTCLLLRACLCPSGQYATAYTIGPSTGPRPASSIPIIQG